MMNVKIVVTIFILIRLVQGVCYFGLGDNCFYPCRCQDASVGEYTGGVCNSLTGYCSSGCMNRQYNTSNMLQYWNIWSGGYGCIRGWSIAEGKPATQINGSPTEAAKALDYYRDMYEPGSGRFCTSIYSGHPHVGAWWRVDLQGTYCVNFINVYTTYDTSEAKNFEHVHVWLSDGLTSTGYNYRACNTHTSNNYRQPGGSSYHNCGYPYNVQHILVEKTGGNVLSNLTICEVRVTGYKYYKLGTDCSRCQSSHCSAWGFCTNCKRGYYGPTCESLRTINGSLTITGELFNNTLLDESSLDYQQLKIKLSYWLISTCLDEGHGCYNKLSDVTFSQGSIQADYTLQVLESQTEQRVLLTILAMINNGTFTGNDTAYVINGTTVTVGNISEATLFKRTTGGGRITTDYNNGNDDSMWNKLIALWFDTFCCGDRVIPTILCVVDSTTMNYCNGSVKFNFTLKLSTSIDDELFFKTWRDAIRNNGFSNQSYTLDQLFFGKSLDECASSPCLSGSSCVDEVNGYTCTCVPGYTGTLCNIEKNECDSDPCLHNSTCIYQFNHYSCFCADGYTGSQCLSDINACHSTPGLSGFTSEDLINGYSCTCVTGYTGANCETEIDDCLSSPCISGSTCMDALNGYSCVCAVGYTGAHCETDFNECQSTLCLSGSTCVDGANGYSCTCGTGYTGEHCETDINECLSTQCVSGSTCVDLVNGYSCTCVTGYTGTHCETDIDECGSDTCLSNSTCADQVYGYLCLCRPGFTGVHCETDIYDCSGSPCQGSSTCVDEVNGYSCVCGAGYTGTHCETDINECLNKPCLSGSTCVDQINGYVCMCLPGYTGAHCQTEIDGCLSGPCPSDFRCVDQVVGYSCICDISNMCGSVKLTSHLPSYGPVAGGTNITLLGIFTDIVQLTFTLHKENGRQGLNDSLVCSTVSRNQTHALMTTPRVDDSHSGVKYSIQASYTDVNGVSASIKTQFVFTYKPNPTVTDIFPREALLSGGIKVTAIGTNLDSVSIPMLTVTVEQRIYSSNKSEYTVGQRTQYLSDNTTVNNSTSIIATTPEIPQFTSDDESRPSKQQQSVAFFGMKFDGVKKFNNLSEELGDKGTLQLYSDPVIQGFEQDVLMYDSQTDTHIEIKGERFTLGASIQDYTITIGDGLCEVLSPLLDNVVTCKPPSSEPKAVAVTGKEFREGQPLVMMFVGNAKFYISYIDYIEGTNILLYTVPPVVGVIIIVILIVSIVVCCKRNRNHENQTKNTSTTDNHSTISSAMRSEYLSTTPSPNIDSSYLNTSSSQGRYRENLRSASQPCKEETRRMYTDGYHVSPDQLNIQLDNNSTRYRDEYLAPAKKQHHYVNRGYEKAKSKNAHLQRLPYEQEHGVNMSERNRSEARYYTKSVLPRSNRSIDGY